VRGWDSNPRIPMRIDSEPVSFDLDGNPLKSRRSLEASCGGVL